MKLIDKYLSKIDLDNLKSYGGYNWINPYIKEVPLKNVMQLSFNSLYPNIICGIVESGLHKSTSCSDGLKKSLESFKEKFEYFDFNKRNLKLTNPSKYSELKKGINSFYGQLGFLSKTDMSPNYPGFVTEYLRYYYDDLLSRNSGMILYIDTDTIFYVGEIDLLEFNIPYDIEHIDYIMFSEKKRYVMQKSEMITKGYHKNAQDAIDILRRYIRNDKIEELGI
jgi:DNA polymerase elongation subunit (family B)